MKRTTRIFGTVVVALGLGMAAPFAAGGDGEASRKTGDKDAKETRPNAKEKAEDVKEKVKSAAADAETAKEKAEARADHREDRQGNRIQHGIKKGYLTTDETKSLQAQQQKIADLESGYQSDGKLSKEEIKGLQDALNVASVNIWAEKHDTEGNQMPTYRLGKNVFAKDSYTRRLSNQNLTGQEAKALTADFRKMLHLKHSLATDDLSDDARAKKQAEYDTLLNQYFEVH